MDPVSQSGTVCPARFRQQRAPHRALFRAGHQQQPELRIVGMSTTMLTAATDNAGRLRRRATSTQMIRSARYYVARRPLTCSTRTRARPSGPAPAMVMVMVASDSPYCLLAEIHPWCARASTGAAPNAGPDAPIASVGNLVGRSGTWSAGRPASVGNLVGRPWSARRGDHPRGRPTATGLPGAAPGLGGRGERGL